MKMIGKEIINIVITEQIDTNAMIILIARVGLTIELKIRSKRIVLDVLTNHHKKRAKSKAKAMKWETGIAVKLRSKTKTIKRVTLNQK